MKLEYFCNHEWEAEWIGEAERLVRTKYVEQYEQQADKAPTTPSTSSITHHNSRFALFGDLSVTTAPRASEIQEYLSHPVENVKDLLRWWVDNKTVYPRLHRMALDYLSVPGKSGIHCNGNNTDNNTDMYIGQQLPLPLSEYFLKAAIFSHSRATASPLRPFGRISALGHGHIVVLLFCLMW